jgi:hypothetical protein
MGNRKFKNKITGDIVTEMKNKDSKFYSNEVHTIPALFVEKSNDWQEIIEHPIGTKVKDADNVIYEKFSENKWFNLDTAVPIDELEIGENKKFQVMNDKNPYNLEIGKTYCIRFKHNPKFIEKIKIKHFTQHGHPYAVKLDGGSLVLFDWSNIELVKKEYEILELITHSFVGVTKCKLDIQSFENGWNPTKEWEIKTIKRLSDNEIFTIGDECEDGVIKSFKLNPNKNLFVVF